MTGEPANSVHHSGETGYASVSKSESRAASPDRTHSAVLVLLVLSILASLAVLLRPKAASHIDTKRWRESVLRAAAQRGLKARARAVRAACQHPGCACDLAASKLGLDVGAGKDALKLLDGVAASCGGERSLPGMRSEALVHAGRAQEGYEAAAKLLAQEKRDQYSSLAMALVARQRGEFAETVAAADRSAILGRGAPAYLLLGLAAFEFGDVPHAREYFEAALREEPEDLDARYNLALTDQRLNRYREAREGYLAVLRAAPARAEARYNLAILAHGIGANDEARHHRNKLAQLKPKREMLESLDRALALEKGPAPIRGADAPPVPAASVAHD